MDIPLKVIVAFKHRDFFLKKKWETMLPFLPVKMGENLFKNIS